MKKVAKLPTGDAKVQVVGTHMSPPTTLLRERASVFSIRSAIGRQRVRQVAQPVGNGLPVLLIPGLGSGDYSMTPLANHLKASGYKPARSGIRLNIGCTRELIEGLEKRAETLVERSGGPIAVTGWSRGGTLGRLLATRRPDLVAGLVAIASPNVNPTQINPKVAAQVNRLLRLHEAGFSGVMGPDCVVGRCADETIDELTKPVDESITYYVIYTRSDGIVDWRSCLDASAELIEVKGTHLGIGKEPEVLEHVARILAPIGAR